MRARPLKLVHTSDVHLDGRNVADDIDGFRNKAERAFAAVIDVTIEERADLLLIAGDLFDNNRVPDGDFDFVRDQLARLSCPVVVLPGNHDVHDHYSIWRRIAANDVGGHVHLLLETDGASIEFDDLGVRAWGRAMAEHAPENEPLEGVPGRRDGVWNIGLAHGLVVSEREGIGSSQITHEEIGASGFDYLALGHVHVWRDESQGATTACYPGSPVGSYASAAGGHVAVASLSPERGVELTRRKVDDAPERRKGIW